MKWMHQLIKRISASKQVVVVYILLSGVWLIASGPLIVDFAHHPYIIDSMRILYMIGTALVLYIMLEQQKTLQASKAQYDHLFDTLLEPILIHRHGRIVAANQCAVGLLDASSRDDLVGKAILDFVHPMYQAEVKNRIGRLKKGVSTELLEEQFITLTGRIIDVEVLAVPTTLRGQRVIEVFIRDITVRKQNAATLQASEQRYRELNRLHELILASTTEGIIGVDTEGNVLFCNAAVTWLTGYDREELMGQSIHQTVYQPLEGCSRERACEVCRAMSRGEIWFGNDEALRRRDGTNIPVECAISPLRDEEQMIGAVVVFRDITERKRAEDMLLQSEKLATAGELAAGIAHEIRNPLTALKGFLQMMSQTEGGNTYYYDIMLRELGRIESIVNEFLVLAKPNTLEPELSSIEKVLEETVALLSAEAAMRGVQVGVQVGPEIPPVHCDRNRIKQVFLNLVKNAMEAMPPDGGKIQIVATLNDDGQVMVIIADNGMGIPEEHLSRLGNPFYTTKETGTGLGLLVSQRIIRSHGGNLQVFSQVGRGTQVEITLPLDARQTGGAFGQTAGSGLE